MKGEVMSYVNSLLENVQEEQQIRQKTFKEERQIRQKTLKRINRSVRKRSRGTIDPLENVQGGAIDPLENVQGGAIDPLENVQGGAIDPLKNAQRGAIDPLENVYEDHRSDATHWALRKGDAYRYSRIRNPSDLIYGSGKVPPADYDAVIRNVLNQNSYHMTTKLTTFASVIKRFSSPGRNRHLKSTSG